MSLCVDRIVPGAYHVLILSGLVRHILQHLGNGLPGDGHLIAMQRAVCQQYLHHLRNAAGLMQIGSDIFSGRLQIAQHRHPRTDDFKIINGQRHLRGMRDGQQMQHRVG